MSLEYFFFVISFWPFFFNKVNNQGGFSIWVILSSLTILKVFLLLFFLTPMF